MRIEESSSEIFFLSPTEERGKGKKFPFLTRRAFLTPSPLRGRGLGRGGMKGSY